MAKPSVVIVKITAYSGLAECSVCGAIVSWHRTTAQLLAREDVICCPCCKGSCDVEMGTVHATWGAVKE